MFLIKKNIQNIFKLATDIIKKYNGKFLIRGGNQIEFEEKGFERTVVVEFNSFEDALDCYKSDEYQSALKFVKNSSKRMVSSKEDMFPSL